MQIAEPNRELAHRHRDPDQTCPPAQTMSKGDMSALPGINNALIAETEARSKALTDAGNTIGLKLDFVNVTSDPDLDGAFASLARRASMSA
jgi:hypothetical protein